jgi:Na+-translocating ferredoxin:NAD+ oxidoreductase subunit G
MASLILKHASKTAIVMVAFAIIFTAMMAYVHLVTEDAIAQSEAEARLSLFKQILPEDQYDNKLLEDTIEIAPNSLLGNTLPSTIYRARNQEKPSAVILEAIAHDGYSGDIKLLIAIKSDGSLGGVRVLSHKETPGLGDYIEIGRSDWIAHFNDQSLAKTPDKQWAVKKDGGDFDYMVGATITPRAVVKAVHHALQYAQQHQAVLFK